MATEEVDDITGRFSVLQSVSASNLEDSLNRNICWTQAMQAQIANAMNRIEEEPAVRAEPDDQAAQLLQQDQQLAEILDEEMTHREQVSVLSHMHLQQAEEVKAQSQEIRRLLALVKQLQQAIEKLTSPHNPPKESRAFSSCSETQLDNMREEIFNLILGTVNTIRGTAVSHNNTMASVPRVSQTSFEDMLAEETNFTPSCQQKHVTFKDIIRGVLPDTHPIEFWKRWSYHQDPMKETTQRKLVYTHLPVNFKRCGSLRSAN